MGPLARLGLASRRGFGRVTPDPFVLAVGLSLLVLLTAIVAGDWPGVTAPGTLARVAAGLETWGSAGLWKLLAFAMQMVLMLVLGTALAGNMEEYSFFSYEANEALHLAERERTLIEDCLTKVGHELKQGVDKHTKRLLISHLQLFLNYCIRFYDRQFITRSESNKDIIADFEGMLGAYFVSEELLSQGFPSVKYFAEQLHLSPNYLSDLLKKETGKNGTEHIQIHVVELAKDRLLSSSVSVSEIAYDLGFEYPQYFSKLFKKNTGQTPAEYRNLN